VTSATPAARQGEVWFASLDPVQGREQAGRRPVLVVSVDQFGTGPSQLAIVAPLTTRDHHQRIRVHLEPPEGGVRTASWIMPEQVRTIARQRLVERWGQVRPSTLEQVIRRIHLLTRAPVAVVRG
jgi:mRNA interferase MazF